MSLRVWLLSLGALLIVYLAFLVREITQVSRGGWAVGPLVFIDVLLKPQFWLAAVVICALVFWATFRHAPGPR
jgi:hypothetical protein